MPKLLPIFINFGQEYRRLLTAACAALFCSAGGRQDLADSEAADLKILEEYLPAQMSREDLEAIVVASVSEAGATNVKQMGAVMKIVIAKAAGRADNKTINDLIKSKLSA